MSIRRVLPRALALTAVPLALTVSPPPAASSSTVFAPRVEYATGGVGGPGWHETSTAAADFNSDGRPDVVMADYFNPLGSGPLLMLNKGDGTFKSPGTRISVGTAGVGTVLTGDFNADAKADLLLTSDVYVWTLLGDGQGGFSKASSWPLVQGFQDSAVIADLDHDGKADLVIKTWRGVHSYLGRGDGTFATGPFSTIPGSFTPAVSGITKADFNGDAYPDLAATDAATQQVFALAGDGHGGFTIRGTGTTLGDLSLVPGTVLAGDLNGDHVDDVVALNEFSRPGTAMAVLISDGKGGFEKPRYHEGGFNPATGAIADLDRDGDLDVISSDTTGSKQVVQLGDGRGGFTDGGGYPVTLFPQTPVVADFDGDDKPDVAVGGTSILRVGLTHMSVLINRS